MVAAGPFRASDCPLSLFEIASLVEQSAQVFSEARFEGEMASDNCCGRPHWVAVPWVVGATASHLRMVAAGDRRDLYSLHCISGFFSKS